MTVEKKFFRLKHSVYLHTDEADWVKENESYEGIWDQSYPPKHPPDLILVHPRNQSIRVKLPSNLFEEVNRPD